jgi:hypothetical protein
LTSVISSSPGGDVDDLVVVHVEAGDGEVRLRHRRLLLDGNEVLLLVEDAHAVALGVLHAIAEQRRATELGDLSLEHLREAMAVEDVVAEGEADVVGADELAADDEGLGETIGVRLLGVLDAQADIVAIAEETTEERQVVRGRDEQHLADARQHLHRERVVDHWLVVDGHQLLADRAGHGVQSGAGAAGENDALHWRPHRGERGGDPTAPSTSAAHLRRHGQTTLPYIIHDGVGTR